jgi:hypothetical protein
MIPSTVEPPPRGHMHTDYWRSIQDFVLSNVHFHRGSRGNFMRAHISVILTEKTSCCGPMHLSRFHIRSPPYPLKGQRTGFLRSRMRIRLPPFRPILHAPGEICLDRSRWRHFAFDLTRDGFPESLRASPQGKNANDFRCP